MNLKNHLEKVGLLISVGTTLEVFNRTIIALRSDCITSVESFRSFRYTCEKQEWFLHAAE